MRRPSPASKRALLLASVLLVALNLRGAIAAVSPVLPQIRSDLALSAATAGLLTTLPVLCFAAAAPAAAWLARRTTAERSVLIGCLAIAAGTSVRVLDGAPVLMVGTLLVGVAMTIGNVVVPVVIKRDFGHRASTVTGFYTGALAGGAAAAAAATAPLAAWLGWRAALAAWALLALVAAVVWSLATRPSQSTRNETGAAPAADVGSSPGRQPAAKRQDPRLWADPVAWSVTLFLGSQSFCYYSVTAWLPTLLIDEVDLDLAAAGAAMSVFQVVGIGGTLLIPLLARRRPSQSWLGVVVAAGWAVLLLGLALWPQAWIAWTVVGGLAQGAGISFAFTVLVLRAHDASAARALSSMAQLIGYSLGAAGPVVVGSLYEGMDGWGVPLGLLLAVATGQGLAAVLAGRDTTVGGPPAPAPHRTGAEAGRTTSIEAPHGQPREEE